MYGYCKELPFSERFNPWSQLEPEVTSIVLGHQLLKTAGFQKILETPVHGLRSSVKEDS